jgi:type IV secretion system protein TrbG
MLLRKQDSLPCYSPSLPNCLNRLLPLYCTRLRLEQTSQRNPIAELPNSPVDSLCFDYRIKGKNDALKPVRVFDDGQKTFLQISRETQTREAPVLVVLGGDGKQEMVNYRVKGDMYIVDRLFDRAELILGSGRKAQKVEIERERKS